MEISLTDEGKEIGAMLYGTIVQIMETSKSLGFCNLDDVYSNINSIVSNMYFKDENGRRYTPNDQRRIRKDYIHTFVGCFNVIKRIIGNDVEEVIDKCNLTIKSLKG